MKKIHKILLTASLMLFISLAGHAKEENSETGTQLYQRCSACHLPSGQGVPGMFPPLTQRLGRLTESEAGREYLVMVIDAGMMGSIEADGVTYRNVMPAQGDGLGDEGLAAVLNHLLKTFNAQTLPTHWKSFTAKEVASIKQRYPKANNQTVHQLRQKVEEPL